MMNNEHFHNQGKKKIVIRKRSLHQNHKIYQPKGKRKQKNSLLKTFTEIRNISKNRDHIKFTF